MTQPTRSRALLALLGLAPVPGTSRIPRFVRLTLTIGAALLLAFGLLGRFWLPGFAKAQLETRLGEVLHRSVQVERVDIQPFALTLSLQGLRIAERGAPDAPGAAAPAPFLAFDELTVNLSSASLARRAPVISAVRLRGPQINLSRGSDGRFNFSDLLDDFAQRPPSEGQALFSVSNIQLEGGRIRFDDQIKNSHQEISEIALGLPFIANFESEEATWVQPHFSAKVNGAPIRLDAQARPFADRREATLQAKLTGIDLTTIDEYATLPAGINLLSGRLDATLRATYTQAPGQPAGLRVAADLALHEAALRNDNVATPNTLRIDDLRLQLAEFAPTTDAPLRASLTIGAAAIQRHAERTPAIELGGTQVDSIEIDIRQRLASIGNVVLDRLHVQLRRQTDGRLDIVDLFAARSAPPAADKRRPGKTGKISAAPASSPSGTADTARTAGTAGTSAAGAVAGTSGTAGAAATPAPWRTRVTSLKLANAGLRFEDRSLPRVAPLLVEPLNATATGIDFSGAEPLQLTLDAAVNRHGALTTKGRIGWSPLLVELAIDARQVDLVSLQGWAGGRLNALLTRGALSFDGSVKAAGSPLKLVLAGDGRLSDLNLLDKANAADLLRWRSLDVGGLHVVTEPLRVDVASLALADFFADVLISPEGQINLKNLVGPADGNQPPAKAASTASATPTPKAAAAGRPSAATGTTAAAAPASALPVRIGRITLQGGAVNFHDRFIRPNYRARLTNLAGRIGPLDPGRPGDVEIRGAIDRAAPLEILGKVDPFGAPLFLDIAASAKGIDLPNLSPYSGKYVGYAIEKGKLSVDVRYHIEQGELRAENNVFLDQLTFGDKVDSPDALDVPVNLAVALLKNPRGEIDIRLPISGSLNDPDFSIGGIIVKVLVNLVVKAVTSPFALLGSLFGGGEELSAVDFAPGRARVAAEAEKPLAVLARALNERPALNLEITGHADADRDREGLKRAVLERKVRAQKAAASAQSGQAAGSLREVELSADEYPRYLAKAYAEEMFPKPKNALGFTRSLPVPEMEQLMLAHIPAGEDELRQLAERRANNVRQWLVEKGKVAPERLFILGAKVAREADGKRLGSRAEFSLR